MKLVIEEPESAALDRYVIDAALATSRLALVEVPRAARIANPGPQIQRDAEQLLDSCLLVDVSDRLLREAAELSSRAVRSLDAIHLATALYLEVDELIAYDRRLVEAAISRGLAVVSPGGSWSSAQPDGA